MVEGIALQLLKGALVVSRKGLVGGHLSIPLPLRMETSLPAMAMLCLRFLWVEALHVEYDKHSWRLLYNPGVLEAKCLPIRIITSKAYSST